MIKQYTYNDFGVKKTAYEVHISFNDKNGKRIQRRTSFDHRTRTRMNMNQAKRYEPIFYRLQFDEHDEKLNRVDFGTFYEKFLKAKARHFKKGTVQLYDGDLRKWLPDDIYFKNIREIESEYLSDLLSKMDERDYPPSKNTKKNVLKRLKTILNSALNEGYISKNPALQIPNIKVQSPDEQVLDKSEVSKFLTEARKQEHPYFHLWSVALLTGMRPGELYALKWENISLVDRVISVKRQWTIRDGYHSTKTNCNRTVPISDDLLEIFKELKIMGPYKEDMKIEDGSSKRFTDLVLPRLPSWRCGNASGVTKEFCKQIGVTPIKFKDLRATFITHCLARGTAYPRVMKIVGHKKMSTTEKYLRMSGVCTNGATDNLNFFQKTEKNTISLTAP